MNRMKKFLGSDSGKRFMEDLYAGAESYTRAERRYMRLHDRFRDLFGEEPLALVSVPGRVEISGNHTDHNRGSVIAGSISLDAAALCSKRKDMKVVLHDLAYNEVLTVDLSLLEKDEREALRPEALIRGVAAGLKQRGFAIGGFHGVLYNEVSSGSGLSSSAVFEVAIGSLFNILYNGGTIDPVDLAKTGQFAENTFFGKPCGLMDQCACAVGGMIHIDFKNSEKPVIEKIGGCPDGYALAVVKTGGNHAALTDAYAAIPAEMKCAASVLGREVLRGAVFDDLLGKASEIRKKCGDRAFLRALHFITENKRVEEQKKALGEGDTDLFFRLVQESGSSSWQNLQNVSVSGDSFHQNMAVTLAVSEFFIKSRGRGAVRVHGGGFAGTILSFIHDDDRDDYCSLMERLLGKGSVSIFSIRSRGAAGLLLPGLL